MIPTVFDHLWQSTLFACAAGLLALVLRRHCARARYWAWFAASIKFLVPFSLLVSAGGWLAPRAELPVLDPPVTYAVSSLSNPFTAAISPIAPARMGSVPSLHITAWLLGVWLAGTIVIAAVWTARWFRLLAVVRAARTVDMADAPVPVKVTSARIEPGLVGILRPVLLLPDGLSAHLSPQEIRSLIAHEACHLRRRDNLTAAIHMLVEAVFWFYPLTWWLGTRLLAERERACDESVLASGHDPGVYAEGILKVCRFCLQAPLACTAGVSGADLKKRVEVIMSSSVARRMSAVTRFSIALAGLASLAAPVLYGLASAPAVAAPAAVQTSTPSVAPTAAEVAHRKYEQTRPQKEVPFNPADFDEYAGYYRFDGSSTFARTYRKGDHYHLQVTGQPSVEIFPESRTEFFATVVAAQMSFVLGRDGRVTGMVVHQNGQLVPFHRASKAEFDTAGTELAKRVKDNTPGPGTRGLILTYIEDLEQGRPQHYDTMSPQLAAAAREQAPKARALVRKEGAFQSLAFSRVAPNGLDVYIATFSHGKLLWMISPLSKDGKVTTLFFRPFPP
ncbi:MAG: M56 family metallopeptidase [Steroidobacteraceae bacterium]